MTFYRKQGNVPHAPRGSRDWVKGDLLKSTRAHLIVRGRSNLDAGEDPILQHIFPSETHNIKNLCTNIPVGKTVFALDSKPSSGKPAIVRILYESFIFVANSNFFTRVWPN